MAAIVSGKELDKGFSGEENGAATAVVCSGDEEVEAVGSGQGETDCDKGTIWGGSFSELVEEEAVVVAACAGGEKIAALVS